MRPGRILQQGLILLAVFAVPAFAGQVLIDGRIREPGGAGLAAAEIELRPILSRFEQGLQEIDGLAPEPVARAVTAADGRFELSAPREGMWEVAVRASGFVPMRFLLTPLLEPASLPAVMLRRDAGLRVRVAGPDGRPLAGVRVLAEAVYLWGERPLPGWELAPRTAASGRDGTLRLPSTRGELLRLWASAPGFPVQEADTARAPGEVLIHLLPGVRHDLAALGADGRPVEAVVRDLQTSLVLGRTGGGRLTVFGPAHGTPWLLLETRAGVRVRFPVPERGGEHGGPARVEVPRVEVLRVEVPRPNPVAARVLDAESRQPVAGGWVWEAGDPGGFRRSDEQGIYRLDATLVPPLRLRAAAPGHALAARTIRVSETLAPLELEPAVSLVGTVVDETGAPAAGAEVRAIANQILTPVEAGRQGRVSARGEVRISGLPPSFPCELLATGAGWAPVQVRIERLGARENRFRLTLRRGRTVSGTIVDAPGSPVAAADVRLVSLGAPPAAFVDAQGREEIERRTETDARGRFAWVDVPAGRYELFVDRPGFAPRRHGAITVPAGGGITDLGRLGPCPPDAGQVLTGRVADPAGRPVAGAEVWIETEDNAPDEGWPPFPAAVSGPDGAFAIRGLSAFSDVRLDLCRTGFVPGKIRIRHVFPEPLPVTLQPAGSVVGRLLSGPGGPQLPGQPLTASSGETSSQHVMHPCVAGTDGSETDEAGWFRIGPLEPGQFKIRGESVRVTAGETREIVLRSGAVLDDDWLMTNGRRPEVAATADLGALAAEKPSAPSVTLDGRILGLAPEELARVRVGLSNFFTFRELGTVDAQGNYRIGGLTPGTADLLAQVDDRRIAETVQIPAGETHLTRDLVFEPVFRVAGSVHGPDGEPIGAAEVELDYIPQHRFDPDRYYFFTSTRSDGSFSFQVPYGLYEVSIRREGYVTLQRSDRLQSSDGQDHGNNFRMDRSIP
jgi:uncharacterized GH25 family protein